MAAGWALPRDLLYDFDPRPAAAILGPLPPFAAPTLAGPQPCNQIAGTLAEQIQRARQPRPDSRRLELVEVVLTTLASDTVREALEGLVARLLKETRDGKGQAAQSPRRSMEQPQQRQNGRERQPGEEG